MLCTLLPCSKIVQQANACTSNSRNEQQVTHNQPCDPRRWLHVRISCREKEQFSTKGQQMWPQKTPFNRHLFKKRRRNQGWKASKSGKYVYKIWETILIYIRTESDILQQCASANIDGSIAVTFKFHYADMLEEQRWCQKRERMLI